MRYLFLFTVLSNIENAKDLNNRILNLLRKKEFFAISSLMLLTPPEVKETLNLKFLIEGCLKMEELRCGSTFILFHIPLKIAILPPNWDLRGLLFQHYSTVGKISERCLFETKWVLRP